MIQFVARVSPSSDKIFYKHMATRSPEENYVCVLFEMVLVPGWDYNGGHRV